MTDDDIIDGIVACEGSRYTDGTGTTAGDRGGPTKYGVTLQTLRNYHHDDAVTADEVKALTESEARAIYRSLYIERPGFGQIKCDNLRAFLCDWGVNSGPRTAIKALQSRLGLQVDGILGTLTAYKANAAAQPGLYDALVNDRAGFYAAIVENDPTQAKFLHGWLSRNNEFRSASWA